MPAKFIFLFAHRTGKRDFLSVSVIIFLMLVSNFWETTFVCFSNLRFSIDPFSSISTAHAAWHACGGHNVHRAVLGMWRERPRFHLKALSTGPKEGSKKRAGESLACPLRSQNAIPAPYAKLPQQGPNNCDTVGIWFGPCLFGLFPPSSSCAHPRPFFLFVETIR